MPAVEIDEPVQPAGEELLTTARLVQQGKQGLGIALQGGESEFQQYEEHRQGQEEDHVQATFDRYSPDHDKFIEGFAAQRTGCWREFGGIGSG